MRVGRARAKNWLVVEGYMDVISLYQAGVHGAVALMGNSGITTQQIEKITATSSHVDLVF